MKSVKVPSPKIPANLKAYHETFGHRQSPEASRAYSLSQLDLIAKEALTKGEPIAEWRDRHKTRLGNVNDQMYKNLKWKSKYEELAWTKSMSETLVTYLHLFGHGPDDLSYKRLTTRQIDRLASDSLKTGFPVEAWKKSCPFPLDHSGKYFKLHGVEHSPMSRLHRIQVLLTEFLPFRRHYAPLHLLLINEIHSIHIRVIFSYESDVAKSNNEPYRAIYFVEGKMFGESGNFRLYDHNPFFDITGRYLIETDTFHPTAVRRHIMKNVACTKQKLPYLSFYQRIDHFTDGNIHSTETQYFQLNFMDWEPYEPNYNS